MLAEKAAPWGLLKNSEITDCISTKWGHRHPWRAKAWEISNWKMWVKLGLYQKIQYSNLNLKIAWHWLRESMMETLSRQWDCFYIIDSVLCLWVIHCLGSWLFLISLTEYCEGRPLSWPYMHWLNPPHSRALMDSDAMSGSWPARDGLCRTAPQPQCLASRLLT